MWQFDSCSQRETGRKKIKGVFKIVIIKFSYKIKFWEVLSLSLSIYIVLYSVLKERYFQSIGISLKYRLS